MTEQSGLKAGDGGFQLTVKGDTTLTGGVIASTDAAVQTGVNRRDTAATHLSDLHNQASYKASAYSVNVGVSSGKPSGSAGIGQDSGSAASDTCAGISSIAGNSSVRSGDAETGIANPFDAQRVAANVGAQVAITAEFGRQAPRAWADYAQAQYKAAQASGNADDAAKWAEGGAYRVAGHTLLGGLSGGVAGAAGAASSASLMPKLGEQLDSSNLPAAVKQAIGMVASTTLGAVSGGAAGAAMGLNVDVNNRQLHPEEERAIAQLAKGDKDKAQRLRAAACYLVKCSAEFLSGPQTDYYSQLERQGASLQAEQQQLLQYQETVVLQKASGYPAIQTATIKNLFQYSREDLVADSHARLTELRVNQLGSLGLSQSQARSLLATAGTAALVAGTVAGYKLGGLDELLATAKVENNAGTKLNNQFYRDGAIADTSRTLSIAGPWKAAVELTPKEANVLLNSSLPVGAKITGRQDANFENAKAIAEGYQPPFVQGTQVLQIVIDKPTKFVRVFGGDSGQVGSWVMKAEDVAGLTPQQIASKYSLPQVPTMIGDVTLPVGTKMNVSVAGGISPGAAKGVVTGDNGGGGGVQFQIVTPDRKLNQQWFNGARNIW